MKFKYYKFNEICSVITDFVANGSFASLARNVRYSNDKNYARLIRLVDFNSNYSIKNSIWVSEDAYKFLKKSCLFGEEIIISNVGANLGTVFKCPRLSHPMTLGPNSIMVKTNELCNQNYLYYYLKSKDGYEKLMSIVSGSAMPKFNKTDLKKIIIKLPELSIQEKAAKILIDIDRKIELNNKINNNLQVLINTIFIRWFFEYEFPTKNEKKYNSFGGKMIDSEMGLIPDGWQICKLSDLIEFSNGCSIDSNSMIDEEKENTYKVFKMGNIKIGGGINKEKTKSWYSKDDCEGLDKYIAKKGDILMCMTDMKNSGTPLLGHTALIDKDDEFIINQRVGIIRCKQEKIDFTYLYTLSNLDLFLQDVRSRANSGVQVNLSTKGICDTLVKYPDKEILKKFTEFSLPMYEKKFNLDEENEILVKLRDNILPKLMNGEIEFDKI